MKCEFNSKHYGHCKSEAIGRAIDAYGGSNLCAEHLKPLENQPDIKITLFSAKEEVTVNHDHFGYVEFVCPKCGWKASSSLSEKSISSDKR